MTNGTGRPARVGTSTAPRREVERTGRAARGRTEAARAHRALATARRAWAKYLAELWLARLLPGAAAVVDVAPTPRARADVARLEPCLDALLAERTSLAAVRPHLPAVRAVVAAREPGEAATLAALADYADALAADLHRALAALRPPAPARARGRATTDATPAGRADTD